MPGLVKEATVTLVFYEGFSKNQGREGDGKGQISFNTDSGRLPVAGFH